MNIEKIIFFGIIIDLSKSLSKDLWSVRASSGPWEGPAAYIKELPINGDFENNML